MGCMFFQCLTSGRKQAEFYFKLEENASKFSIVTTSEVMQTARFSAEMMRKKLRSAFLGGGLEGCVTV